MSNSKRARIYLTHYPQLLSEFHPEKNGDVDPNTVTRGPHKKGLAEMHQDFTMVT